MAKYLTKFTDQAAYEAGDKQYPNVSLLDNGEVKYMAEAPYKVKLKYLNGDVVLVECDGTNSVTSGEVANKSNVVEATFGDCITTIGGGILSDDRNLTAVTIPEGITTIERFAFANTVLTSVDLPSSLTTIGNNAFYKATITSIAFPSGITAISDGVCDNCRQLTSVTFNSGIRTIGQQAFNFCTGLTSITLPSSLISIGRRAFAHTAINTVEFPLGTQTIGGFDDCISLTSVTIPSSVTTIKESCFEETSLREIDIPSSVTTIEGWVFYGCSGLTSITLPSGLTNIGSSVLENCTGLTSITCLATTPPTLGNNAFRNTADCPIFVPAESVSTYQSKWPWSTYASRIQAIQ